MLNFQNYWGSKNLPNSKIWTNMTFLVLFFDWKVFYGWNFEGYTSNLVFLILDGCIWKICFGSLSWKPKSWIKFEVLILSIFMPSFWNHKYYHTYTKIMIKEWYYALSRFINENWFKIYFFIKMATLYYCQGYAL